MHLRNAGCPLGKEQELVFATVARMIDARLLETSCYSAGEGQKTSQPHVQIRRMILTELSTKLTVRCQSHQYFASKHCSTKLVMTISIF